MIDPKPRRTRKHYSEEFKRDAVALFQTAGITAAQVSAELGVSQSVLYRWQRELAVVQEQVERPSYEDLEKELRRLRVENDFLKKASSYFASQQPCGTS